MNSGTNMYQTVDCKPYGSCFMGIVSTLTDFSPKLSVVGRGSSFLYLYVYSPRSVLSGGAIYVFFYWVPPLFFELNMAMVFSVSLLVSLAALKTGLVWSALILRQSNTVEDIAKECDLWNHLACAILENQKAIFFFFFLPDKSACAKNVTELC